MMITALLKYVVKTRRRSLSDNYRTNSAVIITCRKQSDLEHAAPTGLRYIIYRLPIDMPPLCG